jgi:hypothetical protein
MQGGGKEAGRAGAGIQRAQRHGVRFHHRPHPGFQPGLPHRGCGRATALHAFHTGDVRGRRRGPLLPPLPGLLPGASLSLQYTRKASNRSNLVRTGPWNDQSPS